MEKKSKVKDWKSTAVVCLLSLSLISVIAFIAVKQAKFRAERRACYSNQKVLAGVVEMYETDTKSTVTAINEVFYLNVKEAGLYYTAHGDPGAGSNSHLNYRLAGRDLFCIRHGSYKGLKGNQNLPPKQELISAGITDGKLLADANAEFPFEAYMDGLSSNPYTYGFVSIILILALTTARLVYIKIISSR